MLNRLLSFFGQRNAIRRQCSKQIKTAFDGVNLNKQTFSINGVGFIEVDGEKHFYKSGEVEEIIDRLNIVINDWDR